MSNTAQIPYVNQAVIGLLRLSRSVLGPRLHSLTLYGSYTLGDLAPGYGDLDFLVLVIGELSPQEQDALIAGRVPFRQGDHGPYGWMLEGAFLPLPMLSSGLAGEAVWWGTSGERIWQRNELGPFAVRLIAEHGQVVYGADPRPALPSVPYRALVDEAWAFCRSARDHGRGGSLHSVDWLLTAARLLLWLSEGRLASKSEAADWAAGPDGWRAELPRARELRLRPALAGRPEMAAWLSDLTGPIQEAVGELARALAAAGRC